MSGDGCNLGYILNTWEGILEKVDLILIFISVFKKEIIKVTLPLSFSLSWKGNTSHINHLYLNTCFSGLIYFWPHQVARGILGPHQGVQPAPPGFEAWSLNPGGRGSPQGLILSRRQE